MAEHPAGSPYVGVIGAGEADDELAALARQVGAACAAAGAVTVCGGLGGVMEAACRGAAEGGGVTVGLLPGATREHANAYLTVAVATGLGELRNGLVVRASDCLIAVGGSWGTLSEIALAVRTGKPVVALAPWQLPPSDLLHRAESAAGAVDLALQLAAGRRDASRRAQVDVAGGYHLAGGGVQGGQG